MITIITGIPGMGKTSLLVSMMMEEQKKEGGGRPFFVMGVPDLQLDHSKCPPIKEWTERRPDPDDPELMLPYFTFPPNAIVVIDEAQRVYRPRAAGSKVPDHVAAFETHRHTGVDFWLLTQKPMLIDANIRELCGRHIHIRPTILGRYLYEWPEFADVKSKSDRDLASKRRFSPPKKAFGQYKSSVLHVKHKFRLNNLVLLAAAGIIASAYFGYDLYQLYQRKTQQPQAQAEEKTEQPTQGLLEAMTPQLQQLKRENELAQPVAVQATPKVQPVHPFQDYAFIMRGTIEFRGKQRILFQLKNHSNNVIDINSDELQELGYIIRLVNTCSALLFFQGATVVSGCEAAETPSHPTFEVQPDIPPQFQHEEAA